eukprot:2623556-Rhodomonas_salina.1
MDEDGEWHDGVSWELPEHSIHWHKRVLSDFLSLLMAEVYLVQLIADWSRPSPKDRVDAGVPMADTMGKCKLPRRKADSDLAGVFYQLARGSAEKEHLSSSQFLGEGCVVELVEPAGSLFFVTAVRVECSDGQLEGGETELKGYYCKCVSKLCSNLHDSAADFDNHLEWKRGAVTSVVLLGGKSAGYLQICGVLVGAGADAGGNIVVAGMSH